LDKVHQKFSDQTQQLITRLILLQEEQQMITSFPQSTLHQPTDPTLNYPMTIETALQELRVKDYENETLKIHLSALKNEIAILKSKNQTYKELSQENHKSQETLFSQLDQTSNTLMEKDQEISRLRADNEALHVGIMNSNTGRLVKDSLNKLKTQIKVKDAEIEKLYQALDVAKSEVSTEDAYKLLESIPRLEEYRRMSDKVQQLSKDLKKAREDEKCLEAKVAELSAESNRKSLQISSQAMRIMKFQKQTRDAIDERTMLKQELAKLTEQQPKWIEKVQYTIFIPI
jgi:chromosome segregation ATPase